MKKILIILCVLLFFPMKIEAKKYNDYHAEVRYEIDDTVWTESALTEEREFIQKKWNDSECGSLMYGSTDFWESLTSSEKKEMPRDVFNHEVLTEEYISLYKEILKNTNFNIETSELVRYDMNMIKYSGTAAYEEYYFDFFAYITINNGYLIQWQYFGEIDELCITRVNSIISSMNSINIPETPYTLNFANIIIDLFLTIFCYMIYPFVRVIIMKEKYTKETCKKMALYNSIIVGGFFMILTISSGRVWTGGAAMLYYFINKKIWINRDNKISKSNSLEQISKSDITICECGCKVLSKYKKCPKCNKKM